MPLFVIRTWSRIISERWDYSECKCSVYPISYPSLVLEYQSSRIFGRCHIFAMRSVSFRPCSKNSFYVKCIMIIPTCTCRQPVLFCSEARFSAMKIAKLNSVLEVLLSLPAWLLKLEYYAFRVLRFAYPDFELNS